jgi:uncharacterized protein (TIGR03086 family)
MDLDYLDLYKRSSGWAAEKVAGAASSDLGGSTTCSDWTLRDLFNHMLETQRYFAAAGRGEQASPPGQTPPETLTDDPRADFEQVREEVIGVFSEEGVVEKTMPALGIAFADALLHGWDVATSTGQDATMPDGLAAAAYQTIHGRFSDEQRKGVFDPEVPVGDDASDQQRLLAYTGRRD